MCGILVRFARSLSRLKIRYGMILANTQYEPEIIMIQVLLSCSHYFHLQCTSLSASVSFMHICVLISKTRSRSGILRTIRRKEIMSPLSPKQLREASLVPRKEILPQRISHQVSALSISWLGIEFVELELTPPQDSENVENVES